MNMADGTIFKRLLVGLGIVLLIGSVFLAAGCGKKAPVETDVTEPEVPSAPPVVPEEPEPEVEDTGAQAIQPVDYAAMDPAEYGIEDVFFAFDVYELSPEAMATLSQNAQIMRDHRNVTWLIEGHCDERGTVEYNLALGEKRALSTREYLISLGIPPGQLKVTSYGEEKPFSLGHNEDAWAQNRRSHFARP
jgi:peptidoglycan-associated lipoprotein